MSWHTQASHPLLACTVYRPSELQNQCFSRTVLLAKIRHLRSFSMFAIPDSSLSKLHSMFQGSFSSTSFFAFGTVSTGNILWLRPHWDNSRRVSMPTQSTIRLSCHASRRQAAIVNKDVSRPMMWQLSCPMAHHWRFGARIPTGTIFVISHVGLAGDIRKNILRKSFANPSISSLCMGSRWHRTRLSYMAFNRRR